MLFDKDYFELLEKEHLFQTLSESNKPGNAYRSGIYLTKVEEDKEEDLLRFNLLRCSTNLDGGTDNFKAVDYEIINKVNNGKAISAPWARDVPGGHYDHIHISVPRY